MSEGTITQRTLQADCLSWLDEMDTAEIPWKKEAVALFMMLKHPDEQVRRAAQSHAMKWLDEMSSESGIKQLVERGWAGQIPFLIKLQVATEKGV